MENQEDKDFIEFLLAHCKVVRNCGILHQVTLNLPDKEPVVLNYPGSITGAETDKEIIERQREFLQREYLPMYHVVKAYQHEVWHMDEEDLIEDAMEHKLLCFGLGIMVLIVAFMAAFIYVTDLYTFFN